MLDTIREISGKVFILFLHSIDFLKCQKNLASKIMRIMKSLAFISMMETEQKQGRNQGNMKENDFPDLALSLRA